MTGYFANKILINSLWKKGSLKASLDDTLKQLQNIIKKTFEQLIPKMKLKALFEKKKKLSKIMISKI